MSRIAEKVKVLLDLVKFEHSIFALPYAYIGALYASAYVGRLSDGYVDGSLIGPARDAAERVLVVAVGGGWVVPLDGFNGGWPSWQALVWITIAMVGARSFAFVVNRAADAEIDARNPRTAGRAIPAGMIAAGELWLFALVVLAAFLFAVWRLAPVTRTLWPIVLAAFLLYPYTKRFTPLCHNWLGLCLGLAPVGAWVALGAPLGHPAPWVLGLAVALWTAGFDIIYATQDIEYDRRDGVHSMPADRGIARALVQTRVAHVLTVAFLVLGGVLAGASWPWYAGVSVAAALLWYENSIVSARDLSRVNAAFFTVNGVIAIVVFAGALADRLLS
ncbi:MAG: UbiA-like polyprenyltransferase [Actinomycetota bacterium]|nr:UbiA-like polyprenyltransferase [Actinomycetota bacterium]